MAGRHILIVDDDGHIRDVVRFALENAGYSVEEARDGRDALVAAGKRAPDLVVLDITMPEVDGLDVCRQLRATSSVPVIFLSSRDEELDRILGLELGADDYMSKPFSPRELVARVKTVLRRASREESHEDSNDERITHGPLVLDLARHRCLLDGQEIVLTVTEFAMLAVLSRAPGRVLSRDQLVDRACGPNHVISDRTVDSHIRRIRKKLGEPGADFIETVYGVGYRMRDDG